MNIVRSDVFWGDPKVGSCKFAFVRRSQMSKFSQQDDEAPDGKRLDNERGARRLHGESASTCLSAQMF